jgi:hypothetical protein
MPKKNCSFETLTNDQHSKHTAHRIRKIEILDRDIMRDTGEAKTGSVLRFSACLSVEHARQYALPDRGESTFLTFRPPPFDPLDAPCKRPSGDEAEYASARDRTKRRGRLAG